MEKFGLVLQLEGKEPWPSQSDAQKLMTFCTKASAKKNSRGLSNYTIHPKLSKMLKKMGPLCHHQCRPLLLLFKSITQHGLSPTRFHMSEPFI